VQREEKSERSRRLVLDAALKLFSKRGFGATSVREIAETAGVSIGNVYHHFPDKESIFHALLEEYRELTKSQHFPLARVLRSERFPDNLEEIGRAARDTVRQYRAYMALHYVDVIEFGGTHIREFYEELTTRFRDLAEQEQIVGRLRPGVSAASAMLLCTRVFLNYFQLEILFGVSEPFGKESTEVVAEIADILRKGIV
jgi:TetR/AcrR family transcriptional regulator, acrAB operon repressor